MKFVDEAWVDVAAGDGGNGCVAFRHEKFREFGGPSGGDGGRGGDVFALADASLNTLVDFRHARRHAAQRGQHGMGSDRFGAAGSDVTLRVPVGTIINDVETGEVLAELLVADERVLLARGGDGGLGNLRFKSSTNRAPRQRTLGKPGERRTLKLELKVLADVGLLGFPNAGKSTLIAAVTNARPKVADYPFTTLHPHLGVVRDGVNHGFVMADIPGLIEGASTGAGLGHQFLRHLQRTRLLLHLVDAAPLAAEDDPVAQVRAIEAELADYDPGLAAKPRWLVLNKMDLLAPEERAQRQREIVAALGWRGPVHRISARTREGCQPLVRAISGYLRLAEAESDAPAEPADPRFAGGATLAVAREPGGQGADHG